MDESTPIHTTGAYPVFRQASADIVSALEAIEPSGEALRIRERALEFLDLFERWTPRNRPTDEERVRAISDFLEFNRSAQEFIVAHRR